LKQLFSGFVGLIWAMGDRQKQVPKEKEAIAQAAVRLAYAARSLEDRDSRKGDRRSQSYGIALAIA
jgi:hypothetical protein